MVVYSDDDLILYVSKRNVLDIAKAADTHLCKCNTCAEDEGYVPLYERTKFLGRSTCAKRIRKQPGPPPPPGETGSNSFYTPEILIELRRDLSLPNNVLEIAAQRIGQAPEPMDTLSPRADGGIVQFGCSA